MKLLSKWKGRKGGQIIKAKNNQTNGQAPEFQDKRGSAKI